jgi:predicted PurR-regulated permease PerM
MSESQRWVAAAVAFFILFVYLLAPILSPFLVGMLLAYLGDPAADKLEEWGLSRTGAVCVVFLVMTLVLIAFLVVLIPMLGQQIDHFISRMPTVIDWVQHTALPWLVAKVNLPHYELPIADLQNMLVENWQKAGNVAKVVMQKVTSSSLAFVGWIANLLLIPVVAFYMLRDWDILMANIRELLPRAWEAKAVELASECDDVLSAFLRGQLSVMLLLGVIYTIGLMIVGVDLALLLGFVAGLASVVPYLGVAIGVVASSIAALVQFQDWVHLLGVFAVFGIGQMLEGMVITPLLVGDKIGLHPVAVIFAILAGGQLAGFVGILIALPVAAVIMVMLRHIHGNYKNSALYDAAPAVQAEDN